MLMLLLSSSQESCSLIYFSYMCVMNPLFLYKNLLAVLFVTFFYEEGLHNEFSE